MSKIPQGDWSAIAARYQNGESISKIARSYGCTPPAIHYILKRQRQPVLAADQPASHGAPAMAPSSEAAATAALPSVKLDRIAPAPTLVRARTPALAPPPEPVTEPPLDQSGGASTLGLDRELHDRAETAIEVFRTSFDAALAEGSPGVRARLRQAAADLMRVTARITIELDRLSASIERAARAPDYPRSAYTR